MQVLSSTLFTVTDGALSPSNTTFPSTSSQKYTPLIYVLPPEATFSFAPLLIARVFFLSLTFYSRHTQRLLCSGAVEYGCGLCNRRWHIKPILSLLIHLRLTQLYVRYIYVFIYLPGNLEGSLCLSSWCQTNRDSPNHNILRFFCFCSHLCVYHFPCDTWCHFPTSL